MDLMVYRVIELKSAEITIARRIAMIKQPQLLSAQRGQKKSSKSSTTIRGMWIMILSYDDDVVSCG
jgi:hypothetical protein